MNKIIKTLDEVKERFEFWFLKYTSGKKLVTNGIDSFALFDYLPGQDKDQIITKIELNEFEEVVYALEIRDGECLVNTTERFIWINSNKESLNYTDFDQHVGYKDWIVDRQKTRPVSVKHDGYYLEFGLRKQDGNIIYWTMPTGKVGYSFWNITNRCAFVGQKYEIKK